MVKVHSDDKWKYVCKLSRFNFCLKFSDSSETSFINIIFKFFKQ